MAISTRTYPSTQIEVLDGNLISATTLPENVVLVVGKAYKGPSNTVYNVTSTKDANLAFGASSPIIKQMQLALAGGAQNVALFRVGGREASLNNVFGLGTSLATSEASSTADAYLKVYIGPEPLAPSRDAVIIYRNDKIIYSNATGGEVDAGYVEVDGFEKADNELYVGSFYDPVPFRSVLDEIGKRIIVTAVDTNEVELPDFTEATASKYGLTVLVNGKRTTRFTRSANVITIDPTVVASLTSYTVEVNYIQKLTDIEKEDYEFEYKAGQDLINSTWKEYYEAFDQALRELSVSNARAVVIGDLFNVPNIVNGDTVADKLEYLYIEEGEWGEFSYEWSTDRVLYQKDLTGTTLDPYEADVSSNGEPIVIKRFHEVDFAHRAGMWALEKTEEEGFFPNIVVGAIGPKAYTQKYINQWIGKLPTFNEEGKLISNGSGLLGHRYMVGTLDYAGGYYATDSGFPDGDILVDSGNAQIDLGKYLSIVVSQVVPSTGTTNNTSDVLSGAASYAGVIASINPGDGTTNATVRGAYNAIEFKQNRLKDFNNIGYVAFLDKTKGLSVLSGTVASRSASDFQYVGTSVVLNVISQDILDVCDPYIGKGIDGTLMVALHTALHTRLAERQAAGYFVNYTIVMSQVGPNTIKVRYRITAKDELRVISNEIMLDREITSTTIGA